MNQPWERFAARDYDDLDIALAIEVLDTLKDGLEDDALRAAVELVAGALADIEIDLEAHND